MSDAALYVALEEGDLRIEPLDEAHREGLRAACAQDSEIWEIYPFCYAGEYFNPQFESLLRGGAARRREHQSGSGHSKLLSIPKILVICSGCWWRPTISTKPFCEANFLMRVTRWTIICVSISSIRR